MTINQLHFRIVTDEIKVLFFCCKKRPNFLLVSWSNKQLHVRIITDKIKVFFALLEMTQFILMPLSNRQLYGRITFEEIAAFLCCKECLFSNIIWVNVIKLFCP
jgi:hypothetical protein